MTQIHNQNNMYYLKRMLDEATPQETRTYCRTKLIENNLNLVRDRAKKYYDGSVPMDDLFSEGVTGLIHAIDNFDLNKGSNLGTIAVWWIDQRIRKHNKVSKTVIKSPTENKAVPSVVSLEKMIEDSGDFITAPEKNETINIVKILETLSTIERYIICCRYGIVCNGKVAEFIDKKQTLASIAQNIGKTTQRTQQIESSALKRIKSEWKEF